MAAEYARSAAAVPRQLAATDSGAMVREAKGLAQELKSLLKRKEPWDRDLEFQRESLRKAYLRVIFASSAGDLKSREQSRTDVLRARGSSSSTASAAAPTRRLDALNLLWLDTTHALITLYRGRLAELDKQIAAAPKGHKHKNKDRNQIGNGGDILPAAAGPVARRKLVHSFRQFLAREEEFWRTLCGRFASRLFPEEAAELRSVGIVATAFLSANDAAAAPTSRDDRVDDDADAAAAQEAERDNLRAGVLPLAHKALICFGDLARYSELYSEATAPQAVEPHKARGRGGRRGGKGASAASADRRVKTYAKAAECYTQARLLLPDNGNPSNQLAVLAQYASDPLSSIYHYYRALCVRTPFTTAKANLRITFSKAVARWFASDGGEPEGDDAERFKAAFIALHGIFFTKDKLSELPTLSLRLQELFRTVIAERLLVSDAVIKVVTTSLAALWDSRMSRSTLDRSKNGSTMAPSNSAGVAQSAAAVTASPTPKQNLEPQILLHVLALLKILLTRSTIETIELVDSNESHRSSDQSRVPAAQNISAVLRRALPAIRVLTKWLVSQLDYVSRVDARVEASERRRHRVSNGEEAQQLSLDSSASRESSDPLRVSPDEFRTGLDSLWLAYADFANILKVAFPQDELPLDLLDEGVWLEEDVELLGFVPLRRGMKGTVAGEASVVSAREIRRVGRDVHPNDEQLMRVADVLRDAVDLAESHVTGLSLQNGVFVAEPRQSAAAMSQTGDLTTTGAAAAALAEEAEGDDNEDEEMLEQFTEDDPVDRAMRVATASKLGLSDYSADEDEEDEEVVYAGNRSASMTPARSPIQLPTAPPQAAAQTTPSSRTAADLRQLLLCGGPAPPPITGPGTGASVSPSGSQPAPASNIWAPTSGGMSSSPLLGSSIFAAPGSTAPHATFVTPHSFEAIPNLTHGSRAAHAAGWLTNSTTATASAPSESGAAATLPPAIGLGAMYDGAFAPIAAAMAARSATAWAPAGPPPGMQQRGQGQSQGQVVRPPLQAHASLPPAPTSANEVPRLSTAFAGLQRNNSDLSPFAPTFGAGFGGGGGGGGGGPNWGQQQQQPRSNGWG
ncbi:hypothetical protein JCM3774_002567 [Rhodotorula dairenensis]